jgi:hypothetical protein
MRLKMVAPMGCHAQLERIRLDSPTCCRSGHRGALSGRRCVGTHVNVGLRHFATPARESQSESIESKPGFRRTLEWKRLGNCLALAPEDSLAVRGLAGRPSGRMRRRTRVSLAITLPKLPRAVQMAIFLAARPSRDICCL